MLFFASLVASGHSEDTFITKGFNNWKKASYILT